MASSLNFSSKARRGRVTILLVDDDPFKAYARKSALESHFAHVERAAGAAEALILAEQPDRVRDLALIVVDLHLPGLNNIAFVEELTARLPGIAVLVLGHGGENAQDFPFQNVHFLPGNASMAQMYAKAVRILTPLYSRVA